MGIIREDMHPHTHKVCVDDIVEWCGASLQEVSQSALAIGSKQLAEDGDAGIGRLQASSPWLIRMMTG